MFTGLIFGFNSSNEICTKAKTDVCLDFDEEISQKSYEHISDEHVLHNQLIPLLSGIETQD